MKVHRHRFASFDRFSLNGTKEELRALRDRLDEILGQMDGHDTALAEARAQSPNADRGTGGHFVDFHLDEIDGIDDVEASP